MRRAVLVLWTFIVAFICLAGGALAHPHIWIDARTIVLFNDAGEVSGVRHFWKFDEAFSAWTTQGLDVNGDGQISSAEFADLAQENMNGLAAFDFYTFAGTGATDYNFSPVGLADITYDGRHSTLIFTLAPEKPIPVSGRLEIEVADPEYYAAFSFVDNGATMQNAPKDCNIEVNPPKDISDELAQQLFDLGPEVTELPAQLRGAAADLANALIVRCGDVAPAANATEAIENVTRRPASPFVAPPAEKGLPIARTGFLGWVFKQQQNFYGALTGALSQLKTDGNAFWVLGGLSFLYGVFHAAGPGHGKVVISSYMFAAEAEVRRGVALSFISAMMQSVTAVVFVSIAAIALNLTSSALSQGSNYLIIGSYVLVVALGLWLVVRKVFGLGHHHHAPHDHDNGHAHEHSHNHSHDHNHDHDDHMHHAIAPAQTRGGWREMLAVVFAVGLRPCSGALIVLVFALSQGLFWVGVLSVFLMGFGTALSVAILASVAVGIKGAAGLLSGGRYGALAGHLVWWLELLGAFAVLGFGLVFLLANL